MSGAHGQVSPDALTVRASEHGIIRVFAMDMPAQQARFQREPGALEQILGVTGLDPDYIEIFPVADLESLGLAGYLGDGYGVPETEIAPDRDQLNAVQGYVMVVLSRAFGSRAVTLRPAGTLTLIGLYAQEPTDWSGDPIQTQSAQLYTSPPRQARTAARRSGAVVFAVFMLIVAAIVLMVFL